MGGFGVKVTGKNLDRKLVELGARVQKQAERIVTRSALRVESGAKRRAKESVDTGRLRASIATQYFFFPEVIGATVGTDVEYAPFVEFGTGPFGKATNKSPLPPGYVHGGRRGNWLGQAAQPFLFPSWEEERPKFIAEMGALLKELERIRLGVVE